MPCAPTQHLGHPGLTRGSRSPADIHFADKERGHLRLSLCLGGAVPCCPPFRLWCPVGTSSLPHGTGIKVKWVSSSTQPGPRPFPGLPARRGPRGSQRQGQLPKLHRKDPTACHPPPALPQAQPHLSPIFSWGAQHCPLLHSSGAAFGQLPFTLVGPSLGDQSSGPQGCEGQGWEPPG